MELTTLLEEHFDETCKECKYQNSHCPIEELYYYFIDKALKNPDLKHALSMLVTEKGNCAVLEHMQEDIGTETANEN